MSYYDYDDVRVSAAQKKEKARKTMEKLKRTIPDIQPVVTDGTVIEESAAEEEKLAKLLKNADKKSPRVIGDDQVYDLFGV